MLLTDGFYKNFTEKEPKIGQLFLRGARAKEKETSSIFLLKN